MSEMCPDFANCSAQLTTNLLDLVDILYEISTS